MTDAALTQKGLSPVSTNVTERMVRSGPYCYEIADKPDELKSSTEILEEIVCSLEDHVSKVKEARRGGGPRSRPDG